VRCKNVPRHGQRARRQPPKSSYLGSFASTDNAGLPSTEMTTVTDGRHECVRCDTHSNTARVRARVTKTQIQRVQH
jgi:hypothetical protein